MRSSFIPAAVLVACGGGPDTDTSGTSTLALGAPSTASASAAPGSYRTTGSANAAEPQAAAPAPTSASAAEPPVAPAAFADGTVRGGAPGIVRGLYVNRWAAQSARRMRSLIATADSAPTVSQGATSTGSPW